MRYLIISIISFVLSLLSVIVMVVGLEVMNNFNVYVIGVILMNAFVQIGFATLAYYMTFERRKK